MPSPDEAPSLLTRRERPFILVDDLDAPALRPGDHHHFARVRRLTEGQPIVIGDGAGAWRSARFGESPTVDGPVMVEVRKVSLTIGFTPVKAERPEWVVQKLTELGIDRIQVLDTERRVVRWNGERADKNLTKLRAVAREACMQSRQLRVPSIEAVALDELTNPSTVLADPAGAPPRSWAPSRAALDTAPMPITTVLIGPEGGWSEQETKGRTLVGLPGGILRAETAALVAATLLVASWRGDD